MKSAKLLFISHSPDFYGAEKVFASIIEELTDNYEIHAAIPGSGVLTDKLNGLKGVRLHDFMLPRYTRKSADILWNMINAVFLYLSIRRILKRVEPELVYCNTVCNFFTVIVARMAGYRTIWHIHERNESGLIGRFFSCIAVRIASRTIFVSEFVRTSFVPSSVQGGDRCMVIYNGVKDQRRENRRAHLTVPGLLAANYPVLITIAQLIQRKRLGDVVSAMKTIHKEYPGAVLRILGDGIMRAELEGQIRREGLSDCVHLTGYVEDVSAYMDDADMIICPFVDEPFGLVAVEAMAMGIPVIAADSGALPEIVVEGKTGLLYPAGNVAALIEKIRQLAESPEMRYRLGQQGFARATQEFAGSVQVARVRGVIEEVSAAREMQGNA